MQIAQAPPTYATAPPLPTKDLQVTPRRGWMDYTLAAVIIAGVSYVVVMFIKVWMGGHVGWTALAYRGTLPNNPTSL